MKRQFIDRPSKLRSAVVVPASKVITILRRRRAPLRRPASALKVNSWLYRLFVFPAILFTKRTVFQSSEIAR